MTENPEIPGEEPRQGSSAPGMEGEGGQYTEGDVGSVEAPADEPADAIREGLADGQVNTTAEERGPLRGDPDGER